MTQTIIITLPCKVGDKVYWFWCDNEGNPTGDLNEDIIFYFYIDEDGIGIAVDDYEEHLGHYVSDGEIVSGVRKIFLNRETAERAFKENDEKE